MNYLQLICILISTSYCILMYGAASPSSPDISANAEKNRDKLTSADTQEFVDLLTYARYVARNLDPFAFPRAIATRNDPKLTEISKTFINNDCAFEALLILEAEYRQSGITPEDHYDLKDYIDFIDKLRPHAPKCSQCSPNSDEGCSIS